MSWCQECLGTKKMFVVKEHYRAFCMMLQYVAESWMCNTIPCPFCQAGDVYTINDREVEE